MQQIWIHHDTYLPDVTLRVTAAPSKSAPARQAPAASSHSGRQTPAAACHGNTTHNELVHTTTNHPWLTADHGWLPASFLAVGELVQRADGTTATVVAIRAVPGAAAMWDLTVSQVHIFAVGTGAFVVHSCGNNDTFIGQPIRRRVDNGLLDPPTERGDVPTEKATGKPIEIHHVIQDPTGPFEEMTPFEHRGKGNFRANHPFLGKDYPSRIDRDLFEQQKDEYWAGEWDRGRWR